MLAAQFEFSEAYSHADMREYHDHKDEVNCLAFSLDLEMMVTGGDEGRVRVFNRKRGHLVTRLLGHQGAIKSVAISADSRFIASASMDRQVYVWRTSDAQLLFKLTGHASGVETVSFSHDALHLCSGGWDCTAIVWSLETGVMEKILTGHHKAILCSAFSPRDSKLFATGSWDHHVHLWSLGNHGNSGICRVLEGHQAAVMSVVFSKQGMLASSSHDKMVILWNPRSATLIRRLGGHAGWVRALSFSLDGTVLASASDDETCKLWDVMTGDCARSLALDMSIGQAHCIIFSADNALIIGGANILKCRKRTSKDGSGDIT